MKENQEDFSLSQSKYEKTLKSLRSLSVRYQKEENRERFQAQRKKEMSIVSLKEIQDILASSHVRSCINDVVLITDETPSVTMSQFIALRDVMITMMAITSLRRLMEFAEFRLSEFAEREFKSGETNLWIVRISRHKTAAQGPSLVFLSETEEKALAAFLEYHKPLAAVQSRLPSLPKQSIEK